MMMMMMMMMIMSVFVPSVQYSHLPLLYNWQHS